MIIAELLREQRESGWISDDAARAVAERLAVPLHRVEGVRSFYPLFRRTPPAVREIAVCRDLACHMRGAADLAACARAAAAPGVEVREVSCLGLCDAAPAALVDHEPLGDAATTIAAVAALTSAPTSAPTPHGPARAPLRLAHELPPPPPFDADALLAALDAANLRGMGGAGFPTAKKWRLVRAAAGTTKVALCNADESEPGTFKDRELLERVPELVLEGLWLGARVVGATRAIVYLRHEYEHARVALERALAAAPPPMPTELFVSPGGYIQGEETALLEALEDRRGEPRNKPPFPGTHGLYGQPTLINNVETLAAAAVISRRGAAWWCAQGVRGAAGLKLISVSGDVEYPGVFEIPLGTTVAELIALAGGVSCGRALLAFAPGGASSNFLPAALSDTPIDFGPLAAAGSMLGSGALVVVAEGRDLLALGANVTRFFRNESCGKCVPCRVGTEKAVLLLDDALAGRRPRDLALGSKLDAELAELEETLRLTSICGLGQVALGPVLSLLRNFPHA